MLSTKGSTSNCGHGDDHGPPPPPPRELRVTGFGQEQKDPDSNLCSGRKLTLQADKKGGGGSHVWSLYTIRRQVWGTPFIKPLTSHTQRVALDST